jgi:hypothetical protein
MAAVAFVEPAAQKKPAAHRPSQLGELRPAVAPHAPPGHGVGEPEPWGQNVPGQQTVAFGDASVQNRPAGQGPPQSADVMPAAVARRPAAHGCAVGDVVAAGHQNPGGQRPSHALLSLPSLAAKVPAGHSFAVALVEAFNVKWPGAAGPVQSAVRSPCALP